MGLQAGKLVPIVEPHVVYSEVTDKCMILHIMNNFSVLIERTSS
jgi:hypothetical protein